MQDKPTTPERQALFVEIGKRTAQVSGSLYDAMMTATKAGDVGAFRKLREAMDELRPDEDVAESTPGARIADAIRKLLGQIIEQVEEDGVRDHQAQIRDRWFRIKWKPLAHAPALDVARRADLAVKGSNLWVLLDSQDRPVTEPASPPGDGMVPIRRQDGGWEWNGRINWKIRGNSTATLDMAHNAAMVLLSDGFPRFETEDDWWVLRNAQGTAITDPKAAPDDDMRPIRVQGNAWAWVAASPDAEPRVNWKPLEGATLDMARKAVPTGSGTGDWWVLHDDQGRPVTEPEACPAAGMSPIHEQGTVWMWTTTDTSPPKLPPGTWAEFVDMAEEYGPRDTTVRAMAGRIGKVAQGYLDAEVAAQEQDAKPWRVAPSSANPSAELPKEWAERWTEFADLVGRLGQRDTLHATPSLEDVRAMAAKIGKEAETYLEEELAAAPWTHTMGVPLYSGEAITGETEPSQGEIALRLTEAVISRWPELAGEARTLGGPDAVKIFRSIERQLDPPELG